LAATDDVVVNNDWRNNADQVENKPDQRMEETKYSRKTCKATATIVHCYIDDKCNQ